MQAASHLGERPTGRMHRGQQQHTQACLGAGSREFVQQRFHAPVSCGQALAPDACRHHDPGGGSSKCKVGVCRCAVGCLRGIACHVHSPRRCAPAPAPRLPTSPASRACHKSSSALHAKMLHSRHVSSHPPTSACCPQNRESRAAPTPGARQTRGGGQARGRRAASTPLPSEAPQTHAPPTPAGGRGGGVGAGGKRLSCCWATMLQRCAAEHHPPRLHKQAGRS